MNRQEQIEHLCREHGLLAVYLFGSRADDGLRLLQGDTVAREGSDLDLGIVFHDSTFDPGLLAILQVELAALFEPLQVNVVPLQSISSLVQFKTIEGHRTMETDSTAADLYELHVMSQASDLLFIKKQFEEIYPGIVWDFTEYPPTAPKP